MGATAASVSVASHVGLEGGPAWRDRSAFARACSLAAAIIVDMRN